MSEDIAMVESYPSADSDKRKAVDLGDSDSDDFGQASLSSRRKRLEPANVAGNPILGIVDEPSVQPGAPLGEDAEELQGNLAAPGTPILSGGYANIFRGIWRSLDGTITVVAVKTLKPIRPTSMTFRPDPIALQKGREKAIQVASGLAFLDSQSPPICHGDIKPENVLVNGLCEAALSDFGLSRVIQELDASTGFTTGDGPKGSQKYMAPELFEEENSEPTLETDVYAFGGLVLTVRLRTGTLDRKLKAWLSGDEREPSVCSNQGARKGPISHSEWNTPETRGTSGLRGKRFSLVSDVSMLGPRTVDAPYNE
ncbi:hypothetical protein FRC04_004694 [Tulasnella sp. 424]|nr:hypothetical protein FRC04_004694 [Tulasnella sp. 424]